jgi:hypothetical protein
MFFECVICLPFGRRVGIPLKYMIFWEYFGFIEDLGISDLSKPSAGKETLTLGAISDQKLYRNKISWVYKVNSII